MGEHVFLRDLVVLLAASLPIVYVFNILKLPPVVGFLLTGALIGPAATGLIRDTETVQLLAEVGVVLLLFVIGLEFSLARLARMSRIVLGCGILQVVVTAALTLAVASALGAPVNQALAFGFVVALSSTAIVLKLLADQAELDAPHGRITLGVLLFQDLCVVPMMLLLPLLSRPEEIDLLRITGTLGTALVAILVIVFTARHVLPALLHQIVRLRVRELFIGSIVLFCFGTAWVTAQLGLSLAIGAFIAGLVVSESEYSHQAIAEVLPLRDLFNSIFFMSMGMLLDVRFLLDHAAMVVALTLGIIVLKAIVGACTVLPFYRSSRTAVLVGILLAQVGEFSFVLGNQAVGLGILDAEQFQLVLNGAILTMVASPFLIAAAPTLTLRWFPGGEAPAVAAPARISGHVVIIGYGLNGENLARVLRETGIPYRIVELNSERVQQASRAGEPIAFGDATRAAVLGHVSVRTAAVLVVAISDPVATRRIVSLLREMNPLAPLIVRTRYVSEIEELHRLGANEVVPEEFETSVEIFARVLRRMHVPANVIQMQIELIRGERYAMLRGLQLPRQHLDDLRTILEASTTETYLVRAGSPAVDRTIRDLQLRRQTGVTIIAVVRDGTPFTNPPPDQGIRRGDVLVMLGSHAQLAAAMRLLDPVQETASA